MLWGKNSCVLLYVVFSLPSRKEQPVFFTLTVNPGSPMGPGNPDGPGIPWSPRSPFSPVGPSRPYGSRKICGFFARLIQADIRNIIARAKAGSGHPKNTLETPDNHQMPREMQTSLKLDVQMPEHPPVIVDVPVPRAAMGDCFPASKFCSRLCSLLESMLEITPRQLAVVTARVLS